MEKVLELEQLLEEAIQQDDWEKSYKNTLYRVKCDAILIRGRLDADRDGT